MMGDNICFKGVIWKCILELFLLLLLVIALLVDLTISRSLRPMAQATKTGLLLPLSVNCEQFYLVFVLTQV